MTFSLNYTQPAYYRNENDFLMIRSDDAFVMIDTLRASEYYSITHMDTLGDYYYKKFVTNGEACSRKDFLEAYGKAHVVINAAVYSEPNEPLKLGESWRERVQAYKDKNIAVIQNSLSKVQ
jgi:hypothetical protein